MAGKPDSTAKTIVLVHGGFVDGSGWEAVYKILREDGTEQEKGRLVAKIQKLVAEFERVLEKYGKGREWILVDIPQKDVVFTQGLSHIVKKRSSDNLYTERDPIKVISKSGKPSLLVEMENTLMQHLSGFINFIPSVYANDSAIALLRSRGLIEK